MQLSDWQRPSRHLEKPREVQRIARIPTSRHAASFFSAGVDNEMGNFKISFPCVIFIHVHSIFNFCDCRTEGTLVPSTCCTSHPCNLDTMTGPATCQPATESCRVFSQFLGVSYLQPRRRHMGLNCKVPPCSPCTEHRCPPPAEAAMLSLDLSQHVGMSCHGSHHPPQVH